MKRASRLRIAMCGAVALLALVVATPADGVTIGVGPAEMCLAEWTSNMMVLEGSMSPSMGATVRVGEAVELSGESEAPLTFEIASAPSLLSTPNIDGGPGSAQPSASNPKESVYSFVSTKATERPGVVYWTVSFSDAGIESCDGVTSSTNVAEAHSLVVEPAPPSEPESTQQAEEEGESKPTSPAHPCVVPRLHGDSLSRARRALRRAHCRLGHVSRHRRRRRGVLVVVGQDRRAGKRLAHRARVGVTVRVEHRRRHRRRHRRA